jgi:hypothetical protein
LFDTDFDAFVDALRYFFSSPPSNTPAHTQGSHISALAAASSAFTHSALASYNSFTVSFDFAIPFAAALSASALRLIAS